MALEQFPDPRLEAAKAIVQSFAEEPIATAATSVQRAGDVTTETSFMLNKYFNQGQKSLDSKGLLATDIEALSIPHEAKISLTKLLTLQDTRGLGADAHDFFCADLAAIFMISDRRCLNELRRNESDAMIRASIRFSEVKTYPCLELTQKYPSAAQICKDVGSYFLDPNKDIKLLRDRLEAWGVYKKYSEFEQGGGI